MTSQSTKISTRHRLAARAFQLVYPLMRAVLFGSREEYASAPVGAPEMIEVPTRHGSIGALLYRPADERLAAHAAAGTRAPLHVLMHGGAFIIQSPHDEAKLARYLASDVGAFVLVPDYSAAPQAQHPVAEQQCYDVVQWAHQSRDREWDPDRVSVGGPSAGGLLALSVALQAIGDGAYVPVAVTTEYGVADMTRTPEQRPSSKRFPVVGPGMSALVAQTYFKGVAHLPSVSPVFDERLGSLPPTLVITAEFDTLRSESEELAIRAAALGADVTRRDFAGVDHAFIHQAKSPAALEAVRMVGDHLSEAYGAGETDA